MKLTLLPNTDEYWNRIATLLNGGQGEISGTYETDGKTFHSAIFPNYGGEFTWIPSEFCEVADEEAETIAP